MAAAELAPGPDCWIEYYEPPTEGASPEKNDMHVMLGDKDMTSRLMRLQDARGREKDFTLAKNGFQLVEMHSKMQNYDDVEEFKRVYYEEVKELVKKHTGCRKVFVYDHNVRKSAGNDFGAHVKGYQGVQGPAKRIHVDSTPEGAQQIMAFMCPPEEVEEIKAGGFLLVNVWKPIKKIDRDPLIFADAGRMPSEDLVRITRSYFNGVTNYNYCCKYDGQDGATRVRDAEGQWKYLNNEGKETTANDASLAPASGKSHGGLHSWWHWGGQEPHEVVLFSSSDTRTDKLQSGAVHGSAPLPNQSDKEVRISCEVRVIAAF